MKLQPNEPAISGLRRIFVEELASARTRLRDQDANRDEAVHESRRCLKRARSILKLLRSPLGERYERDNVRLRRIGRRMSAIRDAAALIEMFDELHSKYWDAVREEAFLAVRAGLASLKAEIESSERLAAAIQRSGRELTPGRPWLLKARDASVIKRGLEDTQRRVKKALARVHKAPQPENFHALRRKVKTHRFQLMALDDAGSAESLKKLDKWLGDAHNLAVMAERISQDPLRFGAEENVQAMLGLIGRRQHSLQEKSLACADKLYGSKPKILTLPSSSARARQGTA
jgi:CHAD domain-containing protein